MVARITKLVNETYSLGESGMWKDGTSRTNENEIRKFAENKQIFAAFTKDSDELLGVIKISKQTDELLEFGQLAIDKNAMKMGVGRDLIQYVEGFALSNGFRKMKLEILFPAEQFEMPMPENEPIDMTNPSIEAWKKKTLLGRIYSKMNYRRVHVGDMLEFAQEFPHFVDALAVPCKYVVYEKSLEEVRT